MQWRVITSFLRHQNSRLPERNCDGVAFRKRTKTASRSRMGHLRKDLPAVAQHFGDMSVHLFHAEEPLPMVGSVPASLVGEGFDLHRNRVASPRLAT